MKEAIKNGAQPAVETTVSATSETLIHNLPSVWPVSTIQNTGEIVGISPIPILLLIGGHWTGKSTTAANIDPQPFGEKPRVKVLDTEGSWSQLRQSFAVDWVDLREKARELAGADIYQPIHLFRAAIAEMDEIQPGQYTTLVIDTFSDLAAGAHQWVTQNPETFGKAKGQFSGTQGSIFAWGDVDGLFKNRFMKLSQVFQTIVLISHEKDEYEDNRRTGNKEIRGRNMEALATVTLWLGKKNGSHYAKVIKSRLSKPVWKDANGTALKRPIMADLLPDVLTPPMRGVTYPAMLADFMERQPDHTQITAEGYDPSKRVLTDDEREEMKLKAIEAQLELEKMKLQTALVARKTEMVKSLVEAKLYADSNEIRDTLTELGLLEAAQDITQLDAVEQALKKARES